MTWVWPIDVLRPQTTNIHLAPRTLAGAASVSGRTQISATGAGIWAAEYASVFIYDRNTVLCWRAVKGYLEGRLNVIDVPLYDYEMLYAPIATDLDWQALLAAVPHSDGAYFSDGSGYAIGEITDITASASAALRATSMTVTVTYGPTLQPGMVFELTHATKGPRWYEVTGYDSTTGILTFMPPLREAIASGDRLKFTNPKCRMRLAQDDTMMLELRGGTPYGRPSVKFVEAV